MIIHPLNKNFHWQQPSAPFELVTPEQALAYREVGGFVLENCFSQPELDALLAELDPIEAAVNRKLADLPEGQPTIAREDEIVFSAHVVLASEVARNFAKHPVFQALARDLIGPSVRLYWDQLVYKRPGTPDEFPWHQDNGYTFVEPQQYLTCWVALTDATVDNGCPWIAPEIHKMGTLEHHWTRLGFNCLQETPENAVALPVEAGSIAVFSSLTPHRTGPNLTNDARKAYILQYAPDGALIYPRGADVMSADDPERQFLITA